MGTDQVSRAANTRWYVGSLLALGIGTFAFLAFVGLFPHLVEWPYLLSLLFAPIILVGSLASVRRSHPPALSADARHREGSLVIAYVLLLALAVQLDIFAIDPGSGWAALVAVLPALPCLYGAWRALRG